MKHWTLLVFRVMRYAIRTLRQTPGFTIIAVLTLALGIGANTAMFSVVNAILLRALPLHEPERLVFVSASDPQRGIVSGRFSLANYEHLRDENRSFSGIAGFAREGLTLTGAGDPEQLTAARVSPEFFDVLQSAPMLGRGFQTAEGLPGGKPVVLISHGLWQRRFASDPRILGKPVTLAQVAYTVIGVMPPDYRFPFPGVDIWLTKLMDYSGFQPQEIRNGGGYLAAIARLKPGVTTAQADAELAVLFEGYRRAHPRNPDADPHGRLDAVPLQENLVNDIRPTLLLLAGAVGLVLLIACANVAGLMLAKATSRAKELAVRAALGAGRSALVRQLLGESLVLAAAGAALGGLLAVWSIPLIMRSSPAPIRLDLPVLAFTLAVSAAAGVIFGLAPALLVSRPDLNGILRESDSRSIGSARRHRARSFLAAGQTALSIVLLIGAGLLVESFRSLQRVDPGFDPHHALAMRISMPAARYPDDAHRSRFLEELTGRIEALPGVRSAAASLSLPLAFTVMAPFIAEGQPVLPVGQRSLAVWNAITPDYFQTLGIRLVRGRPFAWSDDAGAPRAIIVGESLARRFWPNQDPLGKTVTYARREVAAEVVGVADDVKTRGLEAASDMVFYTPYAQFAWPNLTITIRTAGNPRYLANAAGEQVFALDPNLPVTHVQTLEEFLDDTLAQRRQTMYFIAGFAAVALMMAMIGLYGVIAYSVAQRSAEIGIRQAVGAQRRDILRMVLAQGLKLSLAGIAAGLFAAAGFTRLLSRMLYHVSPIDPVAFTGIPILFLLVSLAASGIPAWRAARVDPVKALRSR